MNGYVQGLVAIIGAGPYGLSIAAHLRSQGVNFRIFGAPMQQWYAHSPKGMFLKSEGFASNLFDPSGYSLKRYCADEQLPYGECGVPVALDTFVGYGLSFQRQFVPMVENTTVTVLDRSSAGFQFRLEGGETVKATTVVVATGMSYMAYMPEVLAHLPAEVMSHSGNHHQLNKFKGRDVTVIGGGQSALETAALLHEAGANVRLVVRKHAIAWNEPPETCCRSVVKQLRRPMSHLGPGMGPWVYSNAPLLFHYLPAKFRLAKVQKALGPAGAWWLRDRVIGCLPMLVGWSVREARMCNKGVMLELESPDGELRRLKTEHVIAATGYRFALGSLPFLSKGLISQLRSIQQTPILSSNFESSIAGLYFVGLASQPVRTAMRFLHGARYTAQRVSRHIAVSRRWSGLPRSTVRSDALECEEF